MKLTPAAANLLILAADRADRDERIARLRDMWLVFAGDAKGIENLCTRLKKQ